MAASELKSPFSESRRGINAVESTPAANNSNHLRINTDDILGMDSQATSRKLRNLSMLSPSSNHLFNIESHSDLPEHVVNTAIEKVR